MKITENIKQMQALLVAAGFTAWNGEGDCPFPEGTIMDTVDADGSLEEGLRFHPQSFLIANCFWDWSSEGIDDWNFIVAYRIISPWRLTS